MAISHRRRWEAIIEHLGRAACSCDSVCSWVGCVVQPAPAFQRRNARAGWITHHPGHGVWAAAPSVPQPLPCCASISFRVTPGAGRSMAGLGQRTLGGAGPTAKAECLEQKKQNPLQGALPAPGSQRCQMKKERVKHLPPPPAQQHQELCDEFNRLQAWIRYKRILTCYPAASRGKQKKNQSGGPSPAALATLFFL